MKDYILSRSIARLLFGIEHLIVCSVCLLEQNVSYIRSEAALHLMHLLFSQLDELFIYDLVYI